MAQWMVGGEALTGIHPSPCLTKDTQAQSKMEAFSPNNEDPVFNIKLQGPSKQIMMDPASPMMDSHASAASYVSMSEDESSLVVDMGESQSQAPIHNLAFRARGLGQQECNIKWRKRVTVREEGATEFGAGFGVSCEAEDEPRRGCVVNGDERDLCQLLSEQVSQEEKGVICNSQALCCADGDYEEGKHYKVCPESKSRGASGVAVKCEDLTTGKTFVNKKVEGPIFKNEVLVPLLCKDNKGIPEIYGLIQRGQSTHILQEFAGISLEKLCSSGDALRLRDPGTLLGLAFQGFKTLEKLHAEGIEHLDVKPQNICVDLGQKVPCLKLIDFGSSQLSGEITLQGVTYEYLSPESCRTVVEIAKRQALKEQMEAQGIPQTSEILTPQLRLAEGTDVWALTLSLLYCLCGYHPMVYHCTGRFDYEGLPPEETSKLRIQSLGKIGGMSDADVSRLISPSWPEVLRVLFSCTLRVDPQQRWSAKQAADFIFTYLSKAAQKPRVAETVGPTSVPVIGAPGIRIRMRNQQNGRESRLLPWHQVNFTRGEVVHCADSPAHCLHPGKRKCGGGSPLMGPKVLKK